MKSVQTRDLKWCEWVFSARFDSEAIQISDLKLAFEKEEEGFCYEQNGPVII